MKIISNNEKIVSNTYDYLADNSIVFVKLKDSFLRELHDKINQRYVSLRSYAVQKLDMCYPTLRREFKVNQYVKFSRLLKIAKDVCFKAFSKLAGCLFS